jgi:glycosyltransferase involved in cell wall biosynthesis
MPDDHDPAPLTEPTSGRGPGSPPAPRVAFVMDHPAQHFSPGLRATHDRGRVRPVALYWDDFRGGYQDTGFDRKVTWDVDLLDGYESVATDPLRPTRRRIATIVGWLRRERPDVLVVAGWASPASRAALLWGAVTRTPIFLFGDSSWQHATGGASRRRTSRALLHRLFRRVGAISTGTFNREFYILHGMHPSRIISGVIPIDVDHFASARREATATNDHLLVIGFAGKLIEQKGVAELVRAVALLRDRPGWRLRIVGDGTLRDDLTRLAKELDVDDVVDFVGFVNQQAIPGELAAFDVFVAPSTWDLRILAVAEAMAAGAPVVVSDATGVWGPGDLVEDGVTGRVYRQGHADELADVLRALLDDPAERERLRIAAAERVRSQSPDAFARSLEEAAARAD